MKQIQRTLLAAAVLVTGWGMLGTAQASTYQEQELVIERTTSRAQVAPVKAAASQMPVATPPASQAAVAEVPAEKVSTKIETAPMGPALAKTTAVDAGKKSASTASKAQSVPLTQVEAKKIHKLDVQRSEDGAPVMRVRLGVRTQPFTVQSASAIHVVSTSGEVLQTLPANTAVSVAPQANGVSVQGKIYPNTVVLRSGDKRNTGILQVFGKRYRGDVYVLPSSANAAATVVNYVSLEQYLYGVVPEEAVPSWPLEALKAQAVAARTYALYNQRVNQARAYDVLGDTNSQVYGGAGSEYEWTNKAVDATKGIVMTYKGEPIDALFHADGGGYTEHSENVWGNPIPYLRGVKDYSNNGSTTRWSVTLSRSKLEAALNSAGKGVGTLQKIQLSPLTQAPMAVSDRGVSGRVKSVTFVGSQRSVTLTGEQVMRIFGLKSTLFDFKVQHPLTMGREDVQSVTTPSKAATKAAKELPVDTSVKTDTKRTVSTKKAIAKRLMAASHGSGMSNSEQIPVRTQEAPKKMPKLDAHTFGRGDETVIIQGFGWGHGLGLSQWGAKAMADQAPKGDTSYYETILKHYYQGVTLTYWYQK